jgi:hypothetical protein
MGADMVWRNGEWKTDSSRHADPITRKARNFDELVRNVYEVLLPGAFLAVPSIPLTPRRKAFCTNWCRKRSEVCLEG